MGRARNFPGERVGRLVIVARAHRDARGAIFWACRCDCGADAVVKAHNLQRGATASCGCYRRDRCAPLSGAATHRMTGTPTYISWVSMKARCENSATDNFKHYGGRGIKVCDRWRSSFEAFLADMGERPAGRTLDRIDVNGHYEPGNCRWATAIEQRANRRNPPLDRSPLDRDLPFEGRQ